MIMAIGAFAISLIEPSSIRATGAIEKNRARSYENDSELIKAIGVILTRLFFESFTLSVWHPNLISSIQRYL